MNSSTPFIVRLSNSLIAIALILLFMYLGKSILVPLAFASLFCILLMFPCSFMERKGVPKGVAAGISVIFTVAVVAVIFYFISTQIIGFREDLPKVKDQVLMGISDLQNWAQQKFHITATAMQEYLNSATSETMSHTSSLVGSTVSTLSSTLIYVILVPIYTFLLLLYRKMVVNFLVKSFSEKDTPVVYAILNKTKTVMKGYIVGLCIEMLIVAAMCYLGFMIVGLEYALLLAVITAVLNLIPYIGIFTSAILTLLITFATGSSTAVLGSLAVLVTVHLIDSNILLPKVVGSKVKINALITLLAVLVGSTLWGIPGMFLSIPIVAILKVIFDSVETLNSWGFILGDEVIVNQPRKLPSFKKKPINKPQESTVRTAASQVLQQDESIGNK